MIVWSELASIDLQKLKDSVETTYDTLAASERARIIFVAAVFVGQDSFTDERCEALANGIRP